MKKIQNAAIRRLLSFIVASVIAGTSISGLVGLSNGQKDNKNEKKNFKPKWYITYDTSDKPNLFKNEAEILHSYMANENNNEIDYNITTDYNNNNDNDSQVTNEELNSESEEEQSLRDEAISEIDINLKHLENMANILGEEFLINSNPRYIKNVTKYIYDIINDGIDKQYKLDYICNLYNLTTTDIYLLTAMFADSINENPTTNPYQSIEEILSCVLNNEELNQLETSFLQKYNLSLGMASEESDIYLQEYLNDKAGTCYILVINSLFYKLFDLPLDWKLNYIYNRWNIDEDELEIIIKCMLCEATHHSYIDTYFVTNVLVNRTYSKKWIEGYSNNVYEQLIRPGQFEVYNRGDYKIYGNMSLNDLLEGHEEAMAVIDCLVEGGIATTASNFWGNGYEAKDKLGSVENGNNFFNENDQMSEEDLCPVEERYPMMENKGITRKR